ncbi:MAG TPA: heparinase II/III family protein, partial [Daejeonella sp.]|nr:heparinase II/III family protein [Daejeonella sp.]
WFYNYMKTQENYEDVIFNTKNIPEDSVFDENPVKVFREIGTTVFKSGWEKDDFSFVMRTGAFYNHQHIDQGSIWLADKGVLFIEERHLKNSTYYDDPIYQSKLIQPVAHSTILIDGNEQSQRTGDHLYHAPGFDDHAYIANFLDGKDAAFSSGNIGRIYFDKVKDLSRNVLFIKPRTLLMLDTAIPSEKDAKVTLLYQTAELEHIKAGKDVSNITKGGVTLNFMHLAPKVVETEAEETPHYLYTLQRVRHLKKEGMLKVSASTTNRQPLVMANLITTDGSNGVSEVITEEGDGFVSGVASGKKFAFSTKPGKVYQTGGIETDAASMTWSADTDFVALATSFSNKNASKMLNSSEVLTFEWSADGIKYAVGKTAKLSISSASKPKSVLLNGKATRNFSYDKAKKQILLEVQAGEGVIKVN